LFFPPCSLLAVIKLLKRVLTFAKAGSTLVLTPQLIPVQTLQTPQLIPVQTLQTPLSIPGLIPLSIPGLIPLSTQALTPQTLVRLTRALILAQALTLHQPTPVRQTPQLQHPNS
jgi:hypothetical protein